MEHGGLKRDRVTVELVVDFGDRQFEEVHLDVVAQLIMLLVKHDIAAPHHGTGTLKWGAALHQPGLEDLIETALKFASVNMRHVWKVPQCDVMLLICL